MFKQNSEKFTATATREKPRHDKQFVQTEGELTQAQQGSDRWGSPELQLIHN